MNVSIQINDKVLSVPQGMSMLEAALQNGIYIPHLCHHPDLPELGSCRLCLVETESGEIVPSCTLHAEEGMKVLTDSEKVRKLRQLAMELLLAGHPEDCSTCPKYGKCELQTLIQYVGVSAARMRTRVKGFGQKEQPLIIHDMNRCILCGRCVRACNDLRGVHVLQYNKRDDMETYVGTLQDKLLKDANCRFCGACAEVCPTGTIRDMIDWTPTEKKEALLPCSAACPSHVDVPRYIRFIAEGNLSAATAVVREKVPFPESLGYICVHNCESECRHACLNAAVSIRNLKRYAAQQDDGLWKEKGFHKPATGKKIAVIGGGPAGLTAAMYGAKLGHSVTVFESREKLGGQLRYGIPSYRLPRAELDAEIEAILAQGDITVQTNTEIQHAPELLKQGFDAVFVSIGTHQGVRLPIPGNDLNGVLVNADFLRGFEEGTATVGKHVVILGGGNVAIDCAGAAFRLGAETVDMACLEAYDAMTATDEERAWAVEEGVVLHNSKTFPEILGENNQVTGVMIQSVGNFRKENGRMMFDKLEGTEEVLAADTVIFATGQRPTISNNPEDFGLALTHGNYIDTNGKWETSVPGIWAAGDVVTGTQSVIKAIAGARAAISEIDRYLGGDGNIEEQLAPEQHPQANIGCQEGFAELKRTEPNVVPVPERVQCWKTCGPMDQGFDKEKAMAEANRCLQCDLRFQIHNARLWTDYDHSEVK